MKCEVDRTELIALLKLGQKISGGVREDEVKLCYLEVKDNQLQINTLRHSAQWYTGVLSLDDSAEEGKCALPIEDLLKIVERLDSDKVGLLMLASKFKIQGGARYGTVPFLDNEFPITSIGDDVVDGYEGPNRFANIIRGLCSIGLSGVSTVWGAIRLGDDGRAGATDSIKLLWIPLPLLNGTGREVLIPITALAPVVNMIGDIKVRLSNSFIEFTSNRGLYRVRLLDKEPPPYNELVNSKTAFETSPFPLVELLTEIDNFTKAVSTDVIVRIDKEELRVSTPAGATVEFNSISEINTDFRCQFSINPKDFLSIGNILTADCEIYRGDSSHLVLKSEETIAIIACLDNSLRFA